MVERERLLLKIINSWLTPANPEYQSSIASIGIVYASYPDVLKCRDRLLSFVSNEVQQKQLGHDFENQAKRLQALLIVEMGSVIGLSMDQKQLLQSAYLTQGFVEDQAMTRAALEAWPRIARALEESSKLTEEVLGVMRNQSGDVG